MNENFLFNRIEKLEELMASLDEAQLLPVMKLDGQILVEAGAGSGKTRVIISRVEHMLLCGIPGENILMITFTNKAASEMRERLSERLGLSLKDIGITCGTFHSVGQEILYKYIDLLGKDKYFKVLDEKGSRGLLKEIIESKGYSDVLNERVVQELISLSMNKLMRISDLLIDNEKYKDQSEAIVEVAREYMIYKTDLNVLDYDDILYNWYLLMKKSPEVLDKLKSKYKYILIDEYQDTNKLQNELVKYLNNGNLFLVGDINQSIYGFRGSEIKNILSYKNNSETEIYKLENNYRSVGRIVDMSKDIIRHNQISSDIEVKSTREYGDKIQVCRCLNAQVEADYIVNEYIPDLLSKGRKLSDIAILYRNHEQGRAIEIELMKSGHNYELKRDKRLIDKECIKDILGYLKLLLNIEDEGSLKRITKVLKGVGEVAEGKILKSIELNKELNFNLIGVKNKGLKEFIDLYNSHRNLNLPIVDYIEDYLNVVYRPYLLRKVESYREEVENDISKLIEGIEVDISLNAYIQDMLIQELNVESGYDESRLFISTLHRSKGLEFRDVIILGCNEGKLPSSMSMRSESEIEEERRLFYVGVTRAKDSLLLSYLTRERSNYGDKSLEVSRFLLELDDKHYDHYDIE